MLHGVSQCDEGYKEVQRLDNIYSDWLCVRQYSHDDGGFWNGFFVDGSSPGVHWNPCVWLLFVVSCMPDNARLGCGALRLNYVVEESVPRGRCGLSCEESLALRRKDDVGKRWLLAAEASALVERHFVSVTVFL